MTWSVRCAETSWKNGELKRRWRQRERKKERAVYRRNFRRRSAFRGGVSSLTRIKEPRNSKLGDRFTERTRKEKEKALRMHSRRNSKAPKSRRRRLSRKPVNVPGRRGRNTNARTHRKSANTCDTKTQIKNKRGTLTPGLLGSLFLLLVPAEFREKALHQFPSLTAKLVSDTIVEIIAGKHPTTPI